MDLSAILLETASIMINVGLLSVPAITVIAKITFMEVRQVSGMLTKISSSTTKNLKWKMNLKI